MQMNWLLVACGGALGASIRYGIGMFFHTSGHFPWATWMINLIGCLLSGILFAYTQKYPILNQETRLFVMVGLLGGFTTFSSFGLESFQLIRQGQFSIVLLYVCSSVMCGIICLAIGFYVFQAILQTK